MSHHHGVGKIRKRFMKRTVTPLALEMLNDVKKSIDPNNVFAINNTVYRDEAEEKEDMEGHH